MVMAMCVVNGASTLKPLSHACSSIQHKKAGRQVGPQPAHLRTQGLGVETIDTWEQNTENRAV